MDNFRLDADQARWFGLISLPCFAFVIYLGVLSLVHRRRRERQLFASLVQAALQERQKEQELRREPPILYEIWVNMRPSLEAERTKSMAIKYNDSLPVSLAAPNPSSHMMTILIRMPLNQPIEEILDQENSLEIGITRL
ncbi:hypothetical protein CPB86DRAFT_785040 [Serendipita vermifera]|nr:hypothetical protein CPB86DRAFT_785040 [Serendipita vermifera]